MNGSPLVAGAPRSSWDLPRRVGPSSGYIQSLIVTRKGSLAVPLTLLTKALLLDVDPTTRWMSSLITGGPAPPEDAGDDSPTSRAAPDVASEDVAPRGAAPANDGQDPSRSRADSS